MAKATQQRVTKLPKLYTPVQAAEILQRTVQSLSNDRATTRRIPFVKVLGKVYYLEDDIVKLINEGYRPASAAAQARAA